MDVHILINGFPVLEGRIWHRAAPASPDLLDELRRVAPVALPESYLRLLSVSDGGEGPLPVRPCNLCLDAAVQVIEGIRSRNFGQAEFDGFLIFGSNGGGEYLALDLRGQEPWPVVSIDMVAGGRSAQHVAVDFDTFVALVGREEV